MQRRHVSARDRESSPADLRRPASRSGSGRGKSPRRRRLRLGLIGLSLLAFAVIWIVGWVVGYLNETRYVSVQALVASKSCSQANGCDVTLIYNAPDGTFWTTQFSGVDADRIRLRSYAEVLTIYFASRSSETPISPQDIVPLGATIFLTTLVGLPAGAGGAACLRAGFKPPSRSAMTDDDSPGPITICSGQRLYMWADDAGVVVRNFYFGRASRLRFAWSEISHFEDGAHTKEGHTSWVLVIVLHSGKHVAVLSSVPGPPGDVVAAVREAAEPRGIPADLAGVPMKSGRPHQRALYKDPGGEPGLRYWDGRQWSPLLPSDVSQWTSRNVGESPAAWSQLPRAQGHWVYAATRVTLWTAWFTAFAAVSAGLLTTGLVIVLWWDRAAHHKHMSGVPYWMYAGFAALYALRAWQARRFFVRLNRAAENAADGWC